MDRGKGLRLWGEGRRGKGDISEDIGDALFEEGKVEDASEVEKLVMYRVPEGREQVEGLGEGTGDLVDRDREEVEPEGERTKVTEQRRIGIVDPTE